MALALSLTRCGVWRHGGDQSRGPATPEARGRREPGSGGSLCLRPASTVL